MRFDVARSTVQGNAKASKCGTGNEEIPRFCFIVRNKIVNAHYNPESESKCDMSGSEDVHNVMYYARGSEFVPYLDVFLPKKALTAIVVGSRLNFEETKSNIENALHELGGGYENVDIVNSKTLF